MAESIAHSRTDKNPTRGRWGIVVAAVLVQLALGAVYAWSVFNKPLQAEFGWSKAEAVLPFEVVIGTIFIGSLIGGRIQDRVGPRPVALGGGILYALGTMLASLVSSGDELWLLVLTYGVMGGIGLGAAYITPIAMLAKWFPDRRGLITGTPNAGAIYGAMIVAWSIGGLVGPPVTALLYEASGGHYTVPFTVIAVVALVSLLLPMITRMPAQPAVAESPRQVVTAPEG